MISKKSLSEKLKGLYVIIDPGICVSAGNNPLAVTKACLKSGASILQLRYKDAPGDVVLDLALKIRMEIRKFRALFIMNDRADLAVLSGADGLHLGQNDMPVKIARKIFKGFIGVSTHNAGEVTKALNDKVDNIGFGPVFMTSTKKGLPPAVGLDRLRKTVSNVNMPVVAIGGINGKNIGEVYGVGADCAAVITAVCGAKNPMKAISQLQSTNYE
jgi:thiamine-phosphate pyrophosphorylase